VIKSAVILLQHNIRRNGSPTEVAGNLQGTVSYRRLRMLRREVAPMERNESRNGAYKAELAG
jgi:hypothetical protein